MIEPFYHPRILVLEEEMPKAISGNYQEKLEHHSKDSSKMISIVSHIATTH